MMIKKRPKMKNKYTQKEYLSADKFMINKTIKLSGPSSCTLMLMLRFMCADHCKNMLSFVQFITSDMRSS